MTDGRGTYKAMMPTSPRSDSRSIAESDQSLRMQQFSKMDAPHLELDPKMESEPQVDEIVQFTAPICFCKEGETRVIVDVMRIGRTQTVSCVKFNTRDVSARHGVKYLKTTGLLTFEPGEVLKSIEIPIITDEYFDATTEFSVQLHSPENCFLGAYLCRTRVFILDGDLFPSNKFREEILQGTEEALANMSIDLLFEYMRFTMLRVPTIFWKSILTALVDQLWNVYYLLTIYIQVYLVDVVLHHNEDRREQLLVPNNRYLTAIAVAILYFAPNLILLAVGRLKRGVLDMSKPIRVHLQVNLFRQYLNYTDSSKHLVQVQDLTTAMDADIPMVVEDGYMFMFDLLRGVGKITVVALFMLQKDPRSLFPLVVYPTVMFFFIRARQEQFVELESAVIAAEASATGMLVNAVHSFSLIRDYKQRNVVIERYEKMLALSTVAHDNMVNFQFWNQRLVPWLSLLGIGMYMAIGSQAVLMGQISVGAFLAMIHVYKELGDRFEGLYNDVQSGVRAGSPLVELTRFMSFPTDVSDRMERNRMRRKFMKDFIEKHKHNPDINGFLSSKDHRGGEMPSVFDHIPIALDQVKIPFVKALRCISVEVEPSTLVYITGRHRTGKGTLIRTLTDNLIPKEGHTLYSSHNRCLNVSNEPEVMPYLTLYENLTFGWPNHSPERVKKIFYRLGMGSKKDGSLHWLAQELDKDLQTTTDQGNAPETDPSREDSAPFDSNTTEALEKLAQAANQEKSETSWLHRLSYNERKMIHLARALIYNPEVLVLHKPTDDADVDDVESICTTLREFVDDRGVDLPNSLKSRRRPRTAFFSGNMNLGAQLSFEISDEIWYLSHKDGLMKREGGRGQWHHLPLVNWIKEPEDSDCDIDDRPRSQPPSILRQLHATNLNGGAGGASEGSLHSAMHNGHADKDSGHGHAARSGGRRPSGSSNSHTTVPTADDVPHDPVIGQGSAGSLLASFGFMDDDRAGHVRRTHSQSDVQGLDYDYADGFSQKRRGRDVCNIGDRLSEVQRMLGGTGYGSSYYRDGQGTPPPPEDSYFGSSSGRGRAHDSKGWRACS